MSIADEIEKLNNLKNSGAISDEEFQEAKRKLLQRDPSAGEIFNQAIGSVDDKLWAMFINLSLLLGLTLIGVVVPIILWQLKKNQSPFIDETGKNVANWIISMAIYALICGALTIILIGAFLFWLLAVVNVVFAIVGAVKAYNGELWPFPLAFKFIK